MRTAIEKKYIENILKKEERYLVEFVKRSILRKLKFTGDSDLFNSVNSEVLKIGNEYRIKFNIKAYGRVLDIAAKRRKVKVKKNFKIYDTNIFRTFYITADKLMTGLTDDVRNRIKKQFYK